MSKAVRLTDGQGTRLRDYENGRGSTQQPKSGKLDGGNEEHARFDQHPCPSSGDSQIRQHWVPMERGVSDLLSNLVKVPGLGGHARRIRNKRV